MIYLVQVYIFIVNLEDSYEYSNYLQWYVLFFLCRVVALKI